MSATRLESLKSRLQMYFDAEVAILTGAQSYRIGSRELNRANMSHIREMIKYLENEIEAESSRAAGKGRNKVFGIIPRDI